MYMYEHTYLKIFIFYVSALAKKLQDCYPGLIAGCGSILIEFSTKNWYVMTAVCGALFCINKTFLPVRRLIGTLIKIKMRA